MEREEVITSIEALARAADPASDSPASLEALLTEETLLALRTASSLLKHDGAKRGRFVAAGTPWTAEEDARLAAEFDGGHTVAQMALQHGRSSGAITLRLVKLDRIDAATVKRRERAASVA